jgi:hypothetical protein
LGRCLQALLQALLTAVTKITYDSIRVLLTAETIASGASDSSLLKNLGLLIGSLTIAKNKPLLQKHLDLKEVLCTAYRRGRLIAVIPFVSEVLSSCSKSTVFKPPNPWLMAITGLLAELYSLSGLELNLKREIKAVCAHLGQDVTDVSPHGPSHFNVVIGPKQSTESPMTPCRSYLQATARGPAPAKSEPNEGNAGPVNHSERPGWVVIELGHLRTRSRGAKPASRPMYGEDAAHAPDAVPKMDASLVEDSVQPTALALPELKANTTPAEAPRDLE